MTQIKEFDNEFYMHVVRTQHLNPLIKKVEQNIDPRVGQLELDVEGTVKDVTVNIPEKSLILDRGPGGKKSVDLKPILPSFEGMDFEGESGIPSKGVTTLKLKDSIVSGTVDGKSTVTYDWDKIVKSNQKYLAVKAGPDTSDISEVKGIRFLGDLDKVEVVGDTLNFTIAEQTPSLMAQVGSGSEEIINKVRIIGNTSGTVFDGSTLNINIPDETGGSGVTNQNFKGFFSSLGDIESLVTDPVNNMSYAFAKDSKLGGNYYTPYWYVNNAWTELKQDPALLYSGVSDPTSHGVFSIKPDERITIDSTGQLDLSKLGIDESNLHFHGFYNTLDQLTAAIPRPVVDKSFAYVKHTNGAWIGRKYTQLQSGEKTWQIVAPISAISLVDSAGSSAIPAPLYGFYKNGMIEIDANGLATIKGKEEQTIKVNVIDSSGVPKSSDVKTLQFMSGESYVTLQGDKAFINHPQRVIEYDHEFEQDHNSNDYMGNLFYDKTSQTWMGWGIPSAPGGVDVKWTKLLHPKMSDEVKDLSKRLPTKAPFVTPGIIGDDSKWSYSGYSYVEKDDSTLPTEFRERCGAYFITIIQDVPNDTPRPQERLQVCYADEEGGSTYFRRWNKGTGSSGAAGVGWYPWTRASITLKDIDNHNQSPDAHNSHDKFYKVYTFDYTLQKLKANNWVLKEKELMLVADNRGTSLLGEDDFITPYNGKFRFSGKISLEGLDTIGVVNPTTPWLLKLQRKRQGQSNQTIYECTYNHTLQNQPIPNMSWESGEIELSYGDRLIFTIQAMNSSSWDAVWPNAKFIGMRSFFVMEDATSRSGSRIAETFRRTVGAVNSKQDTGVNVHYQAGASGNVRVYGTPINIDFKPMIKV